MAAALPLEGQIALVTGCGRKLGIGRAIAMALAEAGADVAVTDLAPTGVRNWQEPTSPAADDWRGVESVAEEIQALGRRSIAVVGDVAEEADADRMVAEVVEQLGKVDILVNNAAAPHGPERTWAWEIPIDAFDLVVRVSTRGSFLMARAAMRDMLAREAKGRIINIASLAGRKGVPRRSAYVAAKFSVVGMTQTWAMELAPRGITVNVICPGTTETDRNLSTQAQLARGADSEFAAASMSPPVGRRGRPGDIARMAVFLADPAADFITGQAFNVDGGLQPQ